MTVASPSLARIPGGEFLMGAADGAEDERPVHRVDVDEFFIGRFPVTHDDYAHFVRATGYAPPTVRELPRIAVGRDALFVELASRYAWPHTSPPQGLGSHPVVLVRYDDANAYCAWLTQVLNRAVRLPTEAEWEKAARGGLNGQRFAWGDKADASCGNFLTDAQEKLTRGTRPAGTYAPNGFGLFDMTGNVWEWVSDWYGADYYAASEPANPRGPAVGSMRLVRGGAWVNDDLDMLRCAYRHRVPPDTYTYSIGFRIVCTD